VNDKDLHRLTVINVADGSKVGEVERAYVDPKRKHIVGFTIDTGGGLFSPETSVMADTIEVHSLGTGALTLDSATPGGGQTSGRYDELIDLSALPGRDVVTDDGTLLGSVGHVEFDERTFAISAIDLQSSLFGGGRSIPVGQVMTIGRDLVVVSRAAAEPAAGSPSPG
jgi:uncharacterized protein YrrD